MTLVARLAALLLVALLGVVLEHEVLGQGVGGGVGLRLVITGSWISRTISWNSEALTAWPGSSGSVRRRSERFFCLGSTSTGPPCVATA